MINLPVAAVDWTTCKLIFPFGSITKAGVEQLLSKYTDDFSVANFYAEREIGCNKTTFAVVDIPQNVIQKLAKDNKIKEIDPMISYTKKPKNYEECCGSGGCGCP